MKHRVLPVLLSASILVSAVPWPRVAWAQAAPAIDDEVKLKDGSIYRGTIIELVPNDHVDVLLPSGETRRFKMADVEYQGHAPAAAPPQESPSAPPSAPLPAPPPPPPTPQPEVTVRANKVDVHVESDQDDVTLLYRVGQADIEAFGAGYGGWVGVSGSAREYANVCTAPCDAQLPTGTHHVALSHGGGRAVEASDPIRLTEPSTLRVHYESRLGIRVAGWLLMGASALVGAALIIDGEQKGIDTCMSGTCDTSSGQGEVVAGAVIGIAGPLLSLALALQRDHAHVELVPSDASRLLRLPGTSTESMAAMTSGAPGLAARVRF